MIFLKIILGKNRINVHIFTCTGSVSPTKRDLRHNFFLHLLFLLPNNNTRLCRIFCCTQTNQIRHLAVRGFPTSAEREQVRKRLHYLSNNTGGRVVVLNDYVAHIVFPTYEAVIRLVVLFKRLF